MKDAATLRSSAYRLAAQNGQGSSSAVELATQTAFEAVSYDTVGRVVTLNLGAWVGQTINYTYDPLYRLTAADYDNGSYYHYSYDANGNRVTETTVVGTVESVYDAANRLTSVGGVSYTWDDNGNLLSNGQRSYTYDSANRLTSVTQGMNASTYTYNGLGERVSETVNGATTTFALDLNAGLTQVLADGTNTYLYGNDRIGQFSTSESAYFLGDALGSVRQLADSGGSLTLTRAFEPYGELMNSLGSGSSAYGFTGEWASSSTNLLYLRARYYSGNMGRFLNKDTWQGDYKQPLTLNGWNYVNGNPINYRDPSGYIKEKDADKANSIVRMLEAKSIRIIIDWGNNYVLDQNTHKVNKCGWEDGVWKLRELELIEEAVGDLDKKLNGKISAAVGLASVNKISISSTAMAPPGFLSNVLGDILYLTDATPTNEDWYKQTFIHEFGHVWDYRTGNRLSRGLMMELGTWICIDHFIQDPVSTNIYNRPYCHWDPYYDSGNSTYPEPPPDTNKACANIPPGPNNSLPGCKDVPYSSTYGNGGTIFTEPGAEDWANSLAYYVYDNYHLIFNQIGLQPIRRRYVENQINSLP